MKTGPVIAGRVWGVLIAATVAAGAAAAQAPTWAEARQEAPVSGVDLSALIGSLNSEQWAVRQHAEDALREALQDLASLEAALEGIEQELSLEARRRLVKLGEEVFLRSPRPGVGIQYSRDTEGVRIDATVRGFDANEHLKRGDVILSFGGMATPDEETMRTAIMVHDPDDVVQVDVRRDNEIVSLQLRLGWYRDLQNPRPPDAGAMRRAWAVRAAQRLNTGEAPVAQVDLDPALWRDADAVSRQALVELSQQRRPAATMTPEVTFAGSAADDENLLMGRRSIELDAQRQEWLQQLDARVLNLSERISALELARRQLNGENPEQVRQLEQELERLRALRQELLNIRQNNGRP